MRPQKYPQPKGQKKKKIVKYGMGGLIIIFLICIIWFPLLFISLVRSVVGVVNHPIDVTVMVKLGGYEVIGSGTRPLTDMQSGHRGDVCLCVCVQPLFTMSVQQQSIQPFTRAEYGDLTRMYGNDAVRQRLQLLLCDDITRCCYGDHMSQCRSTHLRDKRDGTDLPPVPPESPWGHPLQLTRPLCRWPCSSSPCTGTRTW